MNISEQVVILSAERKENHPHINERATKVLGDMISDLDIPFQATTVKYGDTRELSYICVVRNNQETGTLKRFAFENFNQESVLYKDVNGQCYLEYQNGQSEKNRQNGSNLS